MLPHMYAQNKSGAHKGRYAASVHTLSYTGVEAQFTAEGGTERGGGGLQL